MRPLRLLVTILSSALFISSLLFLGLSSEQEQYSESGEAHGPFGALFSFHGPSSLFTPTATISLTDDNSTYFAARPAAFGPLLPSKGLSGQIWMGSGFGDQKVLEHGLSSYAEGELGCSDVEDDGWKLEEEEGHTGTGDAGWIRGGPAPRQSVEPWQDTGRIAGKVVLLSRGACGFSEKVEWAQKRGATAVIVGDNIVGGPLVRMYARGDQSNITIPSLFTSHTTAHLLSSLVPPTYGLDTPTGYSHSSTGRNGRNDLQSAPVTRRRWFSGLRATFNGRLSTYEDSRKDQMTRSRGWLSESLHAAHGAFADDSRQREPVVHEGLWVTLTPTNMSTSPFFNTLFVLVVSPLITLGVVYAMLLVRSRIRRRRWRAPKSVVERLPVRTYHTLSRSSSNSSNLATSSQPIPSPTTPLLVPAQGEQGSSMEAASSTSRYGSLEPSGEAEKPDGLAAWRKRYGGKQVECVVCLEEYVDGISKVMSLPCGHEFHAECITPWLTTRRRTCPICKGDVVRSLGQSAPNSSASSPRQSLSGDELQEQAAGTVNVSPSAAMPVPQVPRDMYDDLERGDARRVTSDDERSQSPSSLPSWIGSIQRRIEAFRAARADPSPLRPNAPDRDR